MHCAWETNRALPPPGLAKAVACNRVPLGGTHWAVSYTCFAASASHCRCRCCPVKCPSNSRCRWRPRKPRSSKSHRAGIEPSPGPGIGFASFLRYASLPTVDKSTWAIYSAQCGELYTSAHIPSCTALMHQTQYPSLAACRFPQTLRGGVPAVAQPRRPAGSPSQDVLQQGGQVGTRRPL